MVEKALLLGLITLILDSENDLKNLDSRELQY